MNTLRTQMRKKRAALSAATRAQRADAVAAQFAPHLIFAKAHYIASFLAVNGEQSPHTINAIAQQHGKQVFLPIVKNFSRKLWFGPIEAPRIINKFTIPEPVYRSHMPLWRFDLILVPLTAFDAQGNRIGMGGGYYDYSFAFTKYCHQRPRLIGIAHDFQKTAKIKPQPWDVPLDGIITETTFTLF